MTNADNDLLQLAHALRFQQQADIRDLSTDDTELHRPGPFIGKAGSTCSDECRVSTPNATLVKFLFGRFCHSHHIAPVALRRATSKLQETHRSLSERVVEKNRAIFLKWALLVSSLLTLSACVSVRTVEEVGQFEISQGETVRVFRASDLDSNCRFLSLPEGAVVVQPLNGSMVYRKTTVSPNYKPDNPRYKCNRFRGRGGAFFYTPNPGFSGQDFARVRQPFADGTVVEMAAKIVVRAP